VKFSQYFRAAASFSSALNEHWKPSLRSIVIPSLTFILLAIAPTHYCTALPCGSIRRPVRPWRSAPDKFWLIALWPTQKPESIKIHSAAKLMWNGQSQAINLELWEVNCETSRLDFAE
jgi:hypothetical protein